MGNDTIGLLLFMAFFVFACDPDSIGHSARAVVDAYHEGETGE